MCFLGMKHVLHYILSNNDIKTGVLKRLVFEVFASNSIIESGREQCWKKHEVQYLAHSRAMMIEAPRPPGEPSWID